MLDQLFHRTRVRDRIRANIVGSWIELYVDYLEARGHPPSVIQQYVQGVEHFGVWLTSEQIAIEAVTRATIDSFLHEHLSHCQCPTPAPTCLYQVRAALAHLLLVPGAHPQRPQPVSPPTPVDVAVYFPPACRASIVMFRRGVWAVRRVGGVRRVPAGTATGLSPTSGSLRTGDCPV